MNFIGRHVQILGLLLLTTFVAAAVGLYFDLPARFHEPNKAHGDSGQNYTCPMHPGVVQDHPGRCSKCGMTLVHASAAAKMEGCDNHSSGCCAKPRAATLSLPPGHPPVEGFVAASALCTNHLHSSRP